MAAHLSLALVGRDARAEYRHRVVVLEPPNAEATLEVRARLRGELSAAGFNVTTLPVPPIDDPKELSETAARELTPAAVLFVIEQPSEPDEEHSSEIWLSDRLLRRTFVLKYTVNPADPARDSARVAVQAVEILKADLAELSVTRPELEAPAPVPIPISVLPGPPPPPPPRLGDGLRVEAGAGLLQGFDGFGAAVTPLLRACLSLPSSWLGDGPLSLDFVLTGAAFGNQVRVDRDQGSVASRQEFGTFAVVARLGPWQVVQPMLSLSTGAYRVEVEGSAAPPATSRTDRTWSSVSGAGTGVWLQPSKSFALTLQGEVLVAASRTVVRIAEEPVATAGSPMVLVSASAVGVF
jgi:hypothetical protein